MSLINTWHEVHTYVREYPHDSKELSMVCIHGNWFRSDDLFISRCAHLIAESVFRISITLYRSAAVTIRLERKTDASGMQRYLASHG